ncbi:MAG: chorismate-pyruvate lyase, partial [Reinekea sp.]
MKAVTDSVFDNNLDPDTCSYDWQGLAAAESALPSELRYWLTLPTSLTQALKQRADDFSVEVLEQRQISLALPIDGFHDKQAPCPMFSRKVLLK